LGLLSNLYRHNLTGLGLALVSVGNQDVVLDTLIFGHHDERATFPQETAHQLAGVARSNFDDRGIWLAAVFTDDTHHNVVAVQHFGHFSRRQEQIGLPIVALQETKAVAMAQHFAGDKTSLVIFANFAFG